MKSSKASNGAHGKEWKIRDVVLITGMSYSKLSLLIRKIKSLFGCTYPDAIVSIRDFCEYVNLDEDEVYKFIITERMRKNADVGRKRHVSSN